MNPDNYGSLPACKKLAEILAKKGIAIETDAAYYHIYHPADDIYEWVLCLQEGRAGASLQYDEEIPAYSMPEVWRELPEEEVLYCYFDHFFWYNWIRGQVFSNPNLNDALIELWIWVLRQGKGKDDELVKSPQSVEGSLRDSRRRKQASGREPGQEVPYLQEIWYD